MKGAAERNAEKKLIKGGVGLLKLAEELAKLSQASQVLGSEAFGASPTLKLSGKGQSAAS